MTADVTPTNRTPPRMPQWMAHDDDLQATIMPATPAPALIDGGTGGESFVYFLQNRHDLTSDIRIGFTSNLDARMRSHRSSNLPIRIILLLNRPKADETVLMRAFSAERKHDPNGNATSWFRASAALLGYIDALRPWGIEVPELWQ